MIDLETVKSGFRDGEFSLEYLPIIALDEQRCVGAEALLRWERPTGVVSPDVFIPLIENTPMSGLLTYWVIDQVAVELGDWLRNHDRVELHINVPPEILGRGGLEYAAQKSGLSDVRQKVVLEITERVQIIKIDKGVLLDSGSDGSMPRWAEALAVLLQTTNLDVIVEGVETAAQLELLRAAGVRQAQGYYFSPPLSASAFLDYFELRG
jgi:sensor c-di-GMP phosphodiesterase-like protein